MPQAHKHACVKPRGMLGEWNKHTNQGTYFYLAKRQVNFQQHRLPATIPSTTPASVTQEARVKILCYK
jgi:hypothetical protein